jgi:hypothetical protein
MRLNILKSILAGVAVMGMIGCDVDVEDEGEMPTMEVEPGRAPDVDVHGPDVDVTEEERTVTVPDVDIDTEERTVTTPNVDIDVPEEDEN